MTIDQTIAWCSEALAMEFNEYQCKILADWLEELKNLRSTKEILAKLEKKFGDDFVYYDNATIRHFSPDLVARKHYAKESLEFIKELRSKS